MSDTKTRSFIKTLLWHVIGIAVSSLLIWLLYPVGRLRQTGAFIVLYYVIRAVQYFVYERLWLKISWGRK